MSISDDISNWIKTKVKEANAEGIVVGLSGGIDSSVVAALSKRALGDNVLGLIMPCENKSIDEEHALLVASQLNLKTERIPLDSAYKKLLDTFPSGNKLAVANLKPRLRMLTLYYFANNLNYLVAGTGNKSEIMVGYFTKYGDGGVDILPIGGLLKTEVRELAKELKIPAEILNRVPTAGLWQEQTDEGELGITYEDLDNVLKALESKDTTHLPQELVAKVKGLIEVSEHKRLLPAIFEVNSI
jgi:NAD+ synthase